MPGARPAKVNPAWYVPPLIAYSNAPVGALTTIVPVGVPQIGCAVTEAVGAAGAPSAAFSVIEVPAVIQVLSVVLLTVIG